MDSGKIEALIAPSLEAMGYRLVRVAFTGGRRATLQVMAERADAAAMTVEDCADISRTVSALLDVADPIASAYVLEVSSPGIDRPLVRPEDYARFAGFEAKLELNALRDGRKRFRGRIARASRATKSASSPSPRRSPCRWPTVVRAKLVLTDELLARLPSATRPN